MTVSSSALDRPRQPGADEQYQAGRRRERNRSLSCRAPDPCRCGGELLLEVLRGELLLEVLRGELLLEVPRFVRDLARDIAGHIHDPVLHLTSPVPGTGGYVQLGSERLDRIAEAFASPLNVLGQRFWLTWYGACGPSLRGRQAWLAGLPREAL